MADSVRVVQPIGSKYLFGLVSCLVELYLLHKYKLHLDYILHSLLKIIKNLFLIDNI